jgi:hypothetical protein
VQDAAFRGPERSRFARGFVVRRSAVLGAALARLEGRIALDEVLERFPEWEVDWDKAKLAPTSTVRGWQTLPVFTR